MKHYVGIDLGTTNSAIASFDGEDIRLYKSPEQHDVTPSAIFFDRRGNKYVGQRAYDSAARNPQNAATGFKRFMGTSTPIKLPAVEMTLSPEECSAEVLRVLYGYLPESIRNDPETGTVITVPAAFNQMQKDATLTAAQSAGLGKVALMQEPVAAVMSVMRSRKTDGMFLVYDLGGGTLDIAIAESINGRVSLLAHGGIAMCGGRDFDRILFDNVVKPWLHKQFDIPDDFSTDKSFATLRHMAAWATEKAKIELSSKEESVISLDDSELRIKDQAGDDIYLDIPLTRKQFDDLIAEKVADSINSARETMEKVGLSAHDIGRVVFVGGPTQYKPLRDKVAFELGIAASTDVNPMTAVAEGAAVFAESIDWSSHNRSRKTGRGTISAGGNVDVAFSYVARTPDTKAKVVAKLGGAAASGSEFQIDSIDTGWSSGRIALKDGSGLDVPLSKPGENQFKIFVFDAAGGPISIENNRITITRTAAQIDAIPASHSIGVEAREKIGGRFTLDYLVKEGEQLPKKGSRVYRADETLRAGAPNSIKFKLWEGAIEDPITDNRFIGMFEIRGSDFSDGVIAKGAELQVDYEVLDSGNIVLEVTIPSIGGNFHSGRNFYSRQEGQIDYTDVSKRVSEEADYVTNRINEISKKIDDPKLEQAKERIERAAQRERIESDPESAKQALDDIQEAKKLLALARKENLKEIRQIELDNCVNYFEKNVKVHARPVEVSSFESLASTARRAIDNNKSDFEVHLAELRGKNWAILWRQDWFVIDWFKWMSDNPHMFNSPKDFAELVAVGKQALAANDMDKLRLVTDHLDNLRIRAGGGDEMIAGSNILMG